MSWLRRLSRDKGDQQMSSFRPPQTSHGSVNASTQQQQRNARNGNALQKDTQFAQSPNQSMGSEDLLTRHTQPQSQQAVPAVSWLENPRSYPEQTRSPSVAPTPDLLTKAFNEALKPLKAQISGLTNQVADAHDRIAQLEEERNELFAWLDKRGMRPDVPDAVAKIMDLSPNAAIALNQQLDRKLSILDVDLHRLQDSLNDSLPASHYSTAFLSLLPDVERLASLPLGSSSAFDLVLKIGGNFNDLGTNTEATTTGDPNVSRFYNRLDESMTGIVRRRIEEQLEGGEAWPVARDIKRLEKCDIYWGGAFGQKEYFTRALDVMRYQARGGSGSVAGGHVQQGGQASPRTNRAPAYDG